MVKKCETSDKDKIELLNVASGPARDLLELYESSKESKKLFTDCVEHDPRAIEYATELTQKFNNQIEYIKGNIFKYETTKKYDYIWSAGLFDYFDDPSFVDILRKFISWGKPNSEIILGNICPSHSLKDYMEILMKWPLHIRTSKDLIRLAEEAGIAPPNIKIGIEESGTFLFFHIQL